MRIASGVTDQYIYFVAVDATDFTSRETTLSSFTVYRSRNGGASSVMTTPTINETDVTNMPGVYELLLDEDMTIDAGDDSQEMAFHITHAGMAPVTRTIELYRPKITAGNTLDVTATGAAGIDWANVENQGTTVDLSATDIQLADTVTTLTGHTAQTGDSYARIGAPAGASIAADIGVVSAGVTAVSAQVAAVPTAAEAADAIWDETLTAHVTADSAAVYVKSVLTDTADMQPKLGTPASTDMSADILLVSGQVATLDTTIGTPATATVSGDILTITGRIGVPVASLAADTAEIITYTGGAIPAQLATVDGIVDAILVDTGTTLPAQITNLNDVSTAEVNAEIVDALATDTYVESSGVPAATATIADKISWLTTLSRNKLLQTATLQTVRNDADDGDIATAVVSDDATTATRAEFT